VNEILEHVSRGAENEYLANIAIPDGITETKTGMLMSGSDVKTLKKMMVNWTKFRKCSEYLETCLLNELRSLQCFLYKRSSCIT